MTATWAAAFGIVVVMAPAIPGVASRTRSLLTGRRGPPALQLYADLARLLRKGAIYSRTTTAVFRTAPLVGVAGCVVAALLLPLDGRGALFSFRGDLVLFAGLLALGRFMLILAGMDTGSSFEGMGASRDATVAVFAEPALFLCFIALSLATGSTSLGGMLGEPLAAGWSVTAPSLALVAMSLFVLLLAECSRVPVDDPATHLELTMIHEAVVLDHSGPDLAFILYAAALKLALLGTLVMGVLVPRGGLSGPAGTAVLAAGLLVVGVAVGVVETVMARLRLDRVPQLLVAVAALAALAGTLLLGSA